MASFINPSSAFAKAKELALKKKREEEAQGVLIDVLTQNPPPLEPVPPTQVEGPVDPVAPIEEDRRIFQKAQDEAYSLFPDFSVPPPEDAVQELYAKAAQDKEFAKKVGLQVDDVDLIVAVLGGAITGEWNQAAAVALGRMNERLAKFTEMAERENKARAVQFEMDLKAIDRNLSRRDSYVNWLLTQQRTRESLAQAAALKDRQLVELKLERWRDDIFAGRVPFPLLSQAISEYNSFIDFGTTVGVQGFQRIEESQVKGLKDLEGGKYNLEAFNKMSLIFQRLGKTWELATAGEQAEIFGAIRTVVPFIYDEETGNLRALKEEDVALFSELFGTESFKSMELELEGRKVTVSENRIKEELRHNQWLRGFKEKELELKDEWQKLDANTRILIADMNNRTRKEIAQDAAGFKTLLHEEKSLTSSLSFIENKISGPLLRLRAEAAKWEKATKDKDFRQTIINPVTGRPYTPGEAEALFKAAQASYLSYLGQIKEQLLNLEQAISTTATNLAIAGMPKERIRSVLLATWNRYKTQVVVVWGKAQADKKDLDALIDRAIAKAGGGTSG